MRTSTTTGESRRPTRRAINPKEGSPSQQPKAAFGSFDTSKLNSWGMTAICAFETFEATSRIDVKQPLSVGSGGCIWALTFTSAELSTVRRRPHPPLPKPPTSIRPTGPALEEVAFDPGLKPLQRRPIREEDHDCPADRGRGVGDNTAGVETTPPAEPGVWPGLVRLRSLTWRSTGSWRSPGSLWVHSPRNADKRHAIRAQAESL